MAKKIRTATIRQRVTISAPPDAVYRALTHARQHAAFTEAEATGAARVGARFTAWDGYIEGKHLVLEKARRIVQEWSTTEWPNNAAPSRLEIRLEPKGKGTLLVMVHAGVPASQAASLRQGWKDYYWSLLKTWFARKGRGNTKP